MARLKCIASVLAAVALFTALAQGQNNIVKATVPFEFRAGNRTLPAGDYVISANVIGRSFLEVRDLGSGKSIPLLVGTLETRSVEPKLEFTEVEGRRFLSAVSTGSEVYGFGVPRNHRQLARVIEVENSGR